MDKFDIVRRNEHSTHGAAQQRLHRDPDAFTAGAQYALDHLLASTIESMHLFSSSLADMVISRAAEILTNVHDGKL